MSAGGETTSPVFNRLCYFQP